MPWTIVKRSKRYQKLSFLYWWDIGPGLKARLVRYESVRFLCKDTGLWCEVPVKMLLPFLKDDRRTSRSHGNWGVKVLAGRGNELAFEPPTGATEGFAKRPFGNGEGERVLTFGRGRATVARPYEDSGTLS